MRWPVPVHSVQPWPLRRRAARRRRRLQSSIWRQCPLRLLTASLGCHLPVENRRRTHAPMQELLGVNEPDFGYILDSMVPNGAAVPVTAFCARRVEPEAAFLMRAPLRGRA